MSYTGRRKGLLSFLLRLALWTAIFGFLWQTVGRIAYLGLVESVVGPLLRLVGVSSLPLRLVADQFANFVPFLALVVTTATVSRRWLQSVRPGVFGACALLCEHVFLIAVMYALEHNIKAVATKELVVIPLWILSAALPFVLWVWLCPDTVLRLFLSESDRPRRRSDA